MSIMPLSVLAKCRSLVDFQRAGVKVGFELETMSTEGRTADDESETDEYAYVDALSSWVDDQMSGVSVGGRTERAIRELLQEVSYEYVEESDYRSTGLTWAQELCPYGIKAKEDGSVTGFEFITREDGVSPARFLKLAKQMLDIEHDITDECSFHVHVSVPGLSDFERGNLQPYCTEWLVDNFDEAPAGVKERLLSGQMIEWAKPTTNPDRVHHKRAAVSIRRNTLEFRLWGNVASYEDAMTCLQLTLRSLAYAAEALASGVEPCEIDLDNEDTVDQMVAIKVPVRKIFKAQEEQGRAARLVREELEKIEQLAEQQAYDVEANQQQQAWG